MPNCKHCKKQFPQARFDALEGQPSRYYCIDHAHLAPRVVRTVAPMHKSNNIKGGLVRLILTTLFCPYLPTEPTRFIGLNNKGGLVR
jgi:hypothetical protein